jgi:hypothetical protein
MLHQSVKAAWHTFSEPLEGRVAGMYLDTHNPPLVTCAVGILIDPLSLAMSLPWRRDSDGERATPDQVRAAWVALKARPDLSTRNVSHARALTGLHLDELDIDVIVAKKLEYNSEHVARHHYPFFPDFPADAQLGIMSMAWAVGPDFPKKFPKFSRSVLAGDWAGARLECDIDVGTKGQPGYNPGVIPRNRANRICFANAELMSKTGVQRQILKWPDVHEPILPRAEDVPALESIRSAAIDDHRNFQDEAAQAARERLFDAHDLLEEDEPTNPTGGNVA